MCRPGLDVCVALAGEIVSLEAEVVESLIEVAEEMVTATATFQRQWKRRLDKRMTLEATTKAKTKGVHCVLPFQMLICLCVCGGGQTYTYCSMLVKVRGHPVEISLPLWVPGN